ncbi:MAG: hypothetical protein HY648_11510, partial [Acidobacteria bacterium]|nr:hypothetical protein [Acidobacteriota bacterium]
AGIALEGAVLRPSGDDNKELYGRKISPKELLLDGNVAPPAKAVPLIQLMDKYSSVQSRKPL